MKFPVLTAAVAVVCFGIGVAALVTQVQGLVLLILPTVFLGQWLSRRPIRRLGYQLPSLQATAWAVLLPLGCLGLAVAVGGAAGWIELGTTAPKGWFGSGFVPYVAFLVVYALVASVMELGVEELFFRGWLLDRLLPLDPRMALVASSAVFSLWHLPVAMGLLNLEPARLAVYLVNMLFLGMVFGAVFLGSRGSLVPAALCHGVWNAFEYSLFGFGNGTGLFLGAQKMVFDPEQGLVGTVILGSAAMVGLVMARRLVGRQPKEF